MTDRAFAVITGGGTAGHVLPAIALAEALVDHGHTIDELYYFGAQRGVEARLIPPTGLRSTLLAVSGVQRRWAWSNVAFVPRLIRAIIATERRFKVLRPRVVISVGGYASLPAVIVARRRRIPVIVVSYDRTPGRASRLAARWAAACAVSFGDTMLPRAKLTGAPLRRAILAVDRRRDCEAARRRLGIPDGRTLLVVVGGSLGSAVLNRAVEHVVAQHRDDRALAIVHVSGARDSVDLAEQISAPDGIWYRREVFIDAVADLYAAADLLVGRGGASTVHEVAATGTPAILVPWSGAAEDHQRANVRWLSDRAGAVLIDDGDPAAIAAAVDDLLGAVARRSALGQSAWDIGSVNRSTEMAALIDAVALA